jgi:16S rRNA (cytosine967-C5)-methyltransferase
LRIADFGLKNQTTVFRQSAIQNPQSKIHTISPARNLAFRLIERIEARSLNSDAAVNDPEMERLDARDRHLAAEIIYGVLRRRATLDWLLAGRSSRPWKEIAPKTKIILRMGLYQLWALDRIPDHALVNDAVELAKRELGTGVSRYVNGLLRGLARLRPWNEKGWLDEAPEYAQCSLPPWLWTRWRKRFGRAAAKEYALTLLSPPRAAFRVGTEIYKVPESGPPFLNPSDIVPGAFFASDEAGGNGFPPEAYFQDEASQLIPWLAGPLNPGVRVWDACAAPGGKSAIFAAMPCEGMFLVSSDKSPRRAKHLRGVLSDASAAPLVLAADARIAPPCRSSFDLVCADVPCSGLGTLRRNPEIKWRIRPEDFNGLRETQLQILEGVSMAVRPGGQLLYSTCSTEPEENERVIEDFLETHRDFRLQAPVRPAGIERWTGKDMMVRTFPGRRLWDGFFAALLIRGNL